MAKRMNIDKRIAMMLNENKDVAHFVMNVLTYDFSKASGMVDVDAFEYVFNFMKTYDLDNMENIVKGVIFKCVSEMGIVHNDNIDFKHFLEKNSEAIEASKEVTEVVMDIHNCILLYNPGFKDEDIVRCINLTLAINIFDKFRTINVPKTTTDNDKEETNEGELNMSKPDTIIFGNGHKAHRVKKDSNNATQKVEHVKAEVIETAASESTDNAKTLANKESKINKDIAEKANLYLQEMRKYPDFREFANRLTVQDVVDYQNALESAADLNELFKYIHKIALSDESKANAIMALFMHETMMETINSVEKNNKRISNEVQPKQIVSNSSNNKQIEFSTVKSEPITVKNCDGSNITNTSPKVITYNPNPIQNNQNNEPVKEKSFFKKLNDMFA